MSNVLVTGGAGFVGAYVSRTLLRAGHRVVVYDAAPTMNTLGMLFGDSVDRSLTVVAGEITDAWQVLRLCRQHDIENIVHLASPLTQHVTENPSRGIRDICLGTQTMFEVARQAAVRRVVWASSVAVFGRSDEYPPGPIRNDAPHIPETLYGQCKSLCERAATLAWEKDQVDSVGLRLTVVYGAGRLRGYMSIPSHMLRQAAVGESFVVPHRDQLLNWQYVEEVADSVLCAMESNVKGEGETYNAWGDARTWSDAMEVVSSLRPELEVTGIVGSDPHLAGVPFHFDASEFANRYNYEHSWPLERGIDLTLKTYGDFGRLGRLPGEASHDR
ncbi:MAG: NAD-dependent epimerase/dehydratase family protein [Gemmatimonadaceae bacterium]